MESQTRWLGIAALFLALAVIAGAFGAHALRDRLDAYSLAVWDKAVLYHLIHALGLLALVGAAGTAISASTQQTVGIFLIAGIVLFSGSLYILALSGMRWLGMITPLGGLSFILGWLWLAFMCLSGRERVLH